MLGEKENFKYMGNIGSGHHQTSRDERKNRKRVLQKNEKNSQNQALQQESNQRDKHLGSPPCKILGTISFYSSTKQHYKDQLDKNENRQYTTEQQV